MTALFQPGALTHPYVLFGLVAVVAAAVCGVSAWRRNSAPGNRLFAGLLWCISLECLFSVIRLTTGVWAMVVAATVVVALLVIASGFLTLAFVLVYVGYDRWTSPRRVALLALPVVFFSLATLTNEFHHLVWLPMELAPAGTLSTGNVQFGILGYATLAYVGLYAGGALGLFGHMYWRHAELHDRQGGLLLLSGLITLGGLVIEVTDVHPYPSAFFGPYVFALASPFMLWGIYGHDFLNLVPVARTKVVEGMQDGVAVVDARGRIVDVNPQMASLLSRNESDLVGTSVSAVFDTRELPDGGTETEETTVWRQQDDDRHFRIRRDPIRDEGGRLRGHVVVFSDVTAQKRREEELRRQNERLDQFADTVAHDLRNPLAIARSYANELDRDDPVIPPEKAQEQVAEALDRMDTIIEDILALAREGNEIENPEPFALAAVTTRAWALVESPDATLETSGLDDYTLYGDPDRLQRALENLFRNAVEHGGEDVTVTVSTTDSGFRVADDGPGIPPDRRDRIFEDGYTTNADGTGFGLSIVRAIVDAHGWDIHVGESEADGAAFEIRT